MASIRKRSDSIHDKVKHNSLTYTFWWQKKLTKGEERRKSSNSVTGNKREET